MSYAERPVWTKETFSQTDSKYKTHMCLQRIFREERDNSSISWGIHLADNVNHYLHAPKEYMFRLCYLFNYIFHDHVHLSLSHHHIINI